MANSITLSADIINALSAKITAGTATAEEIVLYTTGLQRLQEGNDFEATVIGLSQSAVDAIDAANSQFVADAATAVSNFSTSTGTAVTDFTTASNTAITDINTARTNLETAATDLANVVSGLPTTQAIENAIDTGLNYVPPNQRIAFWFARGEAGDYAMFTAFDHNLVMQDEAQYTNRWWGSGSNYAAGNGYGASSSLVASAYSNTDAGTSNFFNLRMTSTVDALGGPNFGFYDQYNGYGKTGIRFNDGGTANQKSELCPIVSTYEQDVFLFRDGDQFKLTTGYNPGKSSNHDRHRFNQNPLLQIDDEPLNIHVGYTGFLWPSTGTTGKGLACYNATTNKLLAFDVSTTQNDAFPIVASFAGTKTPRRLAWGLEPSEYKVDYDATADLTGMIIGTNGVANKPASTGTEANYRGKPVLCDNDNIVLVQSIHNGPLYLQRWVPNGTNDNWLQDFDTTITRNGTVYSADNSENSSIRFVTTVDGRYVIIFTQYYHYGGGMVGYMVRVSDGKILKFTAGTNQYQQFIAPFHKNKIFFYGRNFNSNRNFFPMDLDYIFSLNADGSDISALFTNQAQDPQTSAYLGQNDALGHSLYGSNTGAVIVTHKINPLELQNLV